MRRTKMLVGLSAAIAVTLVVCINGASAAAEKPKDSPGVAPRFATVFKIDAKQGDLILVSVEVRFVTEERLKVIERDGKAAEVVEVLRKPVYESRTEMLALESAEVFEAGGKKLTTEEVSKRATAGSAVVISGDGKEIDAAYLNALKNDTLVIVSPKLALPKERAGARAARNVQPNP